MKQTSLLDFAVPPFDGATFEAPRDADRLGHQLGAVRDYLLRVDCWCSLVELERATGYPQASISARIRDLRKPKFGGFHVPRRRRAGCPGTFEYRIARAGAGAA